MRMFKKIKSILASLSDANKALAGHSRAIRFLITAFQTFFKHNIPGLAAIIAFFGFSSLFPLLSLLIYVTTHFIPASDVESFLTHVLTSYVPSIPKEGNFTADTLTRLVSFGTRGVGIIGTVSLLWSGVGGFMTLQWLLDLIFEVRHRRAFLRQYVIGFLMLAILFALTALASILTAISPGVVRAFGSGETVLVIVHTMARVALPLVLFLTCFACYRILPSHNAKTLHAGIGALVATVAIYLGRYGFLIYTHHLRNYQLIYGTLSFVMLFTFWIYITCIILLTGAVITAAIGRTFSRRRPTDPGPNSGPATTSPTPESTS